MDNGERTFGELLTYLREQIDVTLRELARGIGISAPFLRDVEKGRRSALTAERIEKVVTVFLLDEGEKTALYNAAGKQKNPYRRICQIISWSMNMSVQHFVQLVTLILHPPTLFAEMKEFNNSCFSGNIKILSILP